MTITRLLAAAAASSLLLGAGAAFAAEPPIDTDVTTPTQQRLDVTAPAPTLDPALTPPAKNVTVTVDDSSPNFRLETVASSPVPDTPQNRSMYGGPTSNGGRMTAPRGN
ncbi:hypothetical protein BH11PSE2_BH11PSE2_07380 [soil metagenome]